MKCMICGTENPARAKFCMRCGNDVDPDKECPQCGARTPKAGLFCINCGKRLSEKHTCSRCGNEFDGNFCAICGKPSALSVPAPSAPRQKISASYSKIMGLCASAAGLLTVLFSLVFVFLIGLTLPINLPEDTTGPILEKFGSLNLSIYYYFNDAYKDLALELELLTEYSSQYEASLYLVNIMGTVIAAGALLSVVITSVLSAIRLIKRIMGREKAKKDGVIYATFLCYALFTTLFSALHAPMGFNAVTKAGLGLGGIFIGLFALFRILEQGKRMLARKPLVACGLSVLAVAFLSAVLGIGAGSPVSLSSVGQSAGIGLFSLAAFVAQLGNLYLSDSLSTSQQEMKTLLDQSFTTSMIGAFLHMVVLVLAAVAVVLLLKDLTSDKPRFLAPLVTLAVCVLFAIGTVVVASFAMRDFRKFLLTEMDDVPAQLLRTKLTGIILMLVFATLATFAVVAKPIANIAIKESVPPSLPYDDSEQPDIPAADANDAPAAVAVTDTLKQTE